MIMTPEALESLLDDAGSGDESIDTQLKQATETITSMMADVRRAAVRGMRWHTHL